MLEKGAASRKVTHDLDEARRDRDQVHRKLADLLMGKALAQSSLDIAQHVYNMKTGLNEACLQYTRLYARVMEEKAIVKQTMDKKVSDGRNSSYKPTLFLYHWYTY